MHGRMPSWLRVTAAIGAATVWIARADVYYVNDDSTAGDMYCSAVGDDSNDGGSAGAPKLSLTNLIDAVDLEPGDTVYVDTGLYAGYTVTIGTNDQGSAGNPVIFQGSTDAAAGGTVLDRDNAGADVVRVLGISNPIRVEYVVLRNMTLQGGRYGVKLNYANRVTLEDLIIRDNATGVINDYPGSGTGHIVNRCVITGHSTQGLISEHAGILVSNTVFYGNVDAVKCGTGTRTMRNCIFHADGANRTCLANLTSGSLVGSDYNLFFVTNGAVLAGKSGGGWITTVDRLTAFTGGTDSNSVMFDPLFADADGGDFHLSSQEGRYSNGVWVADVVSSPAIDLGDPAVGNGLEPVNSLGDRGRLNLGAYGGTEQASKSRADAYLLALSLNEGGSVAGTRALEWLAGNLAGDAVVRLDYSLDDGASWSNIVDGIAATNGVAWWDSTSCSFAGRAYWRVVCEDEDVADTNNHYFAIRNASAVFYVNDDDTDGDMYCTAAGDDANDGLGPATPMADVETLLAAYDLEGGDTVYIDTGLYTNGSVYVDATHSGASGARTVFQGSTNEAAGGTVFEAATTVWYVYDADWLLLRDMTLRGGATAGIYNRYSDNCLFEELILRDCGEGYHGEYPVAGANCVLRNCLFLDNDDYGAFNEHAGLTCESSTFHGNGIAVRQHSVRFCVSNCVFHVSGADSYALAVNLHLMRSDYNCFFATNGGAVAWNSDLETYDALADWQSSGYGQDMASIEADPLFANAAGGDFHLLSRGGRYSAGAWTVDSGHSPAIDAGPTNWSFANETAPNGARVNMGRYGNTAQASRSIPELPAGCLFIFR